MGFRDNNPRYGKRYAELQHLPESYFTPALRKLREEGTVFLFSEYAYHRSVPLTPAV